jgi:hypothetical protein
MRALAAVLVAAFVIALSGASPAPAQESSTPGIWINPELGLATPADAAERYKAPFHTWWIEEDDPIREEPDWRERAFLLFGEDWSVKLRIWSQVAARDISLAEIDWHSPEADKWPAEIPPPPPEPAPLRVESCAALLAAYRAGLRPRPALELDWYGSHLSHYWLRVQRFYECLALEHLIRLRPLEEDFAEVPIFWGDRATVSRLSPVIFGQSPSEFVQHNLIAELSDTPHLENARKIRGRPHAGDQIIEDPWWPDPGLSWRSWAWSVCKEDDHPPPAWISTFEEYCGGADSDVLDRLWSVTVRGDVRETAGFHFAPEIVVEGEDATHTLTVLGVGGLPEAEGLVLVVMVVEKLKGGNAYDRFMPLNLNYDPELGMFRVINFDDFDLDFLDDVP